MVNITDVNKQLKELNIKLGLWGRSEVRELANILTEDEKISQAVNGYYDNGFALLVSTDHRMLLVDKKPFNFLNIEDFRFDMINQLDYNHRLFNSSINVSAGSKNLRFTSYNQEGLRNLLNCVQCRMIEIKEEQKHTAEQQFAKLDRLEQTLRDYVAARGEQQPGQPEIASPIAAEVARNEKAPQPVVSAVGRAEAAFDNYLRAVAGSQPSSSEGFIKTGSLLPSPDLSAARIAFAKLPELMGRHRQ